MERAYVGQRAELLAQLFLEEIGAAVWKTDDSTGPFDFVAVFHTADQKLRISAGEVKSTEAPVSELFHFSANVNKIAALQHANIPILFLVVDAKHNEIYYGWASEIQFDGSGPKGKQPIRCSLPVVRAKDRKNELLTTILSQPEFSDHAVME